MDVIAERVIIKRFEKINIPVEYNAEEDLMLLSFTEYDLIAGGWSQDRSVLNQPKKGDLIYVKNDYYDEWLMKRFSHFKNKTTYVFEGQNGQGDSIPYLYYSIENPLLKTIRGIWKR